MKEKNPAWVPSTPPKVERMNGSPLRVLWRLWARLTWTHAPQWSAPGTLFSGVWRKAGAILFLEGRIRFHHAAGEQAPENCGAPSVLVAYGEENVRSLEARNSWGRFLRVPVL